MIRQYVTNFFDANEPMSLLEIMTSTFNRMAVLEARADKSTSPKVLLLLPVMFLIFGFALGKAMFSYLYLSEII